MSYVNSYTQWYRIDVTFVSGKQFHGLDLVIISHDRKQVLAKWPSCQGPGDTHYINGRYTFIVPHLEECNIAFQAHFPVLDRTTRSVKWTELMQTALIEDSMSIEQDSTSKFMLFQGNLSPSFYLSARMYRIHNHPLTATSFYTIGVSADLTHSTRLFGMKETTILSVYATSEYYEELLLKHSKTNDTISSLIHSTSTSSISIGSKTNRGILLYRSFDFGQKTKTPSYYTFTFDSRYLLHVLNPNRVQCNSTLGLRGDPSVMASSESIVGSVDSHPKGDALSPLSASCSSSPSIPLATMPSDDSSISQITLRFEITNTKGDVVGINESSLYQVLSPFIAHTKRFNQKHRALITNTLHRCQQGTTTTQPLASDPSILGSSMINTSLSSISPHTSAIIPSSSASPSIGLTSSSLETIDSFSPLIHPLSSHVGASRHLTPHDPFAFKVPLFRDYTNLKRSPRGTLTIHEAIHFHTPSIDHTLSQITGGVTFRPMMVINGNMLKDDLHRSHITRPVAHYAKHIHDVLSPWYGIKTTPHTEQSIQQYFKSYYGFYFKDDQMVDPILQSTNKTLQMHKQLLQTAKPSLLATLTPAGIPIFVTDCSPPPEHASIRNLTRLHAYKEYTSHIREYLLPKMNSRYLHAVTKINQTIHRNHIQDIPNHIHFPPQSPMYSATGINCTGIITNDAQYAFQLADLVNPGSSMDAYDYVVYDTRQLFPDRLDFPSSQQDITSWVNTLASKLKPRTTRPRSQLHANYQHIYTTTKHIPVDPPQGSIDGAGSTMAPIDKVTSSGPPGDINSSGSQTPSGEEKLVDFIAEYIINRTKNEQIQREFEFHLMTSRHDTHSSPSPSPSPSPPSSSSSSSSSSLTSPPFEYHIIYLVGFSFDTPAKADVFYRSLYDRISHLPLSVVFLGHGIDHHFSQTIAASLGATTTALPLGDILFPHKHNTLQGGHTSEKHGVKKTPYLGSSSPYSVFDGLSIPNPYRVESIHNTLKNAKESIAKAKEGYNDGSTSIPKDLPLSPEVTVNLFQRDMFIYIDDREQSEKDQTIQIEKIKHILLLQLQQYIQTVYKLRTLYEMRVMSLTLSPPQQLKPKSNNNNSNNNNGTSSASSSSSSSIFPQSPAPPPFPSWVPTIRPPHIHCCSWLQSPDEISRSSSMVTSGSSGTAGVDNKPGHGMANGMTGTSSTLHASILHSVSSFAHDLSKPELSLLTGGARVCQIEDVFLSSSHAMVIDSVIQQSTKAHRDALNQPFETRIGNRQQRQTSSTVLHQDDDYCVPPPDVPDKLKKSVSGDIPSPTPVLQPNSPLRPASSSNVDAELGSAPASPY